MFNPYLYSTFDSVVTLQNPSKDSERDSQLTLWRDSLRADEPNLPNAPDKQRWSDVSALKKLSYLPVRLTRLTGLKKYLEVKANLMIPSVYRSKEKDKNNFFYLIPRNVTVTYGPYHYLGILDYRLERLHGLQTALRLAGANVNLRAIQHVNHVSVWYLEKEIFACKITDLHHGGDGELDRLCNDAALAFARKAGKVLLHIKHKYRFNQDRGSNLFKDFNDCRPDGTLISDEEHDEEDGEFYDEMLDKNNYDHEEEGQRSEEDVDMSRRQKHLARIYFKPLSHRRVMEHPQHLYSRNFPHYYPRDEQVVEITDDIKSSEYAGEDDETQRSVVEINGK